MRGARQYDTTQQALAELGRRIRVFRLAQGLTQEAAAAEAKMDGKRWQRIERGSANVTIKTLVKIAVALRMTYWQLTTAELPRTHRQRGPRKR